MAVPDLAAGRHLNPGAHEAAGRAGAKGLTTWDVSVDSTVARAYQHAAGARHNGNSSGSHRVDSVLDLEPNDHGLGRARGGLTTELHVAATRYPRDDRGTPPSTCSPNRDDPARPAQSPATIDKLRQQSGALLVRQVVVDRTD